MDKNLLLQKLPPFLHRYTTIKKNQSVFDIVKEVLAAHEIFANDYDRIAADFDYGSNEEIAKRLFNFLKSVRYEIEGEESQTTKSPSALLVQGFGDCKHYAGFIAGVLDALNRRGRQIDWNYRFASYNLFDSEPGHVFVILHDKGKEIWIDPVLKTFNERLEPTFILDKKPKQMLSRVSGIYDVAADTIFFDDADRQLSPELLQAINLLWELGILTSEGKINDVLINKLSSTVSPEQFSRIADARILLSQKAIGGFFSDLWRGVKKVTLAAPRNAYLSLVALNAFGYATKLAKAIYQADGITFDEPNKKKVYNLWNSLGGDWHNLHNAIDSGKKKKAILGVVAALPAWVAAATAIIAAITPLLKGILESKQIDPVIMNDPSLYGGYPYPSTYSGSGGIMDFVQNNPLIVAGGAAVAIYFFTQKRRA